MKALTYFVVVASFLLLGAVSIAYADEADHDSGSFHDGHWAMAGDEVRIPIKCRGTASACQKVADAAKALSDALPHVELGIVGSATVDECDARLTTFKTANGGGTEVPGRWGYMVACIGTNPTLDVAGTAARQSECAQFPVVNCTLVHIVAAQFWTQSTNPAMHTIAHEMQHNLGLCDSYNSICERPVGNDSAGCPTTSAISYLNQWYDHDDGYTTAAPAGAFTVAGSHSCVFGGGTPTPTPTITPTGTPAPTPAPHCPPGWAKKGRC